MFRCPTDVCIISTRVKVSAENKQAKILKYVCELCDSAWQTEKDLEIHRRSYHYEEVMVMAGTPKNHICKVCLNPHKKKSNLIKHLKRDHLLTSPRSTRLKYEIFICNYCKNAFFNKMLLTAHIKRYHLSMTSELLTTTAQCPICFKNLRLKALWFHFISHRAIGTCSCPICLVPLANFEELNQHTAATHPGNYSCRICTFETNREQLFFNHIQTHKKKVVAKEITDVSQYFVPEESANMWKKRNTNLFRGICLAPEVQICIICTTLCTSKEAMHQHILGDHASLSTEAKRHLCVCGEEFFNAVLLKHHVFVLKGEHKVYDGKGLIPIKPKDTVIDIPVIQTDAEGQIPIIEIPTAGDLEDGGTQVEIDHSNSSSTQNIEDQINKKLIAEVERLKNTEQTELSEVVLVVNDENIDNNQLNNTELSLIVNKQQINNEQNKTEAIELLIVNDIQIQNVEINNDTRTNDNVSIDLETENKYDLEKKFLVEQATINDNQYTLTLHDPVEEQDEIKVTQNTDMSPKGRKREIQYNSLLLNENLSKKFKSTKQFYEQVLGFTDDDGIDDDDAVGDDAEHNNEDTSEMPTEVYTVVEIQDNSNEDSRTGIEDDGVL